jgi:signal transduction histidine kinase
MPELVWYRSLYWRIAFGFVALLATLLVAQGLVFLWMTGRGDLFSSRSPAEFAASIASDLSGALAENEKLDVGEYLSDHYSRSFRSFAVVMRDGRTFESQRVPPPPNLVWSARGRLAGDWFDTRRGPPPPGGRQGGGPRGPVDQAPAGGDRERNAAGPESGLRPGEPDRDRPGGREFEGRGGGRGRGRFGGPGGPGQSDYADIFRLGSLVGVVGVPREVPPLSLIVRDLGPWLGVVALGLLIVGTAIAAFAIFGPTRKRLAHLQEAVRLVGTGDFAVRAPETGGDEVTSLSRSFNEMAGQLEERTRALETADRTRRQLLADVSHELMTPLAAIRGYVETLGMTDLRIDEVTRARYLGIVSDEAARLEHIIGDLLDLARFEGGGGRLNIERVSVDSLLERVRHRHAPIVADKGITLNTERSQAAVAVEGDQNRLEQALQNLVANAVRHTPGGGTVTVRATADGGDVVFSVEDTGPGIPADHLPRIFDRFYKVDESRTGTATPSGSGLGLSIVQAIVARHHGTVTASNRSGGGARFEIRLPGRTDTPDDHAVAVAS